jgi:SAM-dependent methyltransferase
MLPPVYHAHHNRHLEDIPLWLALAARAGGPILELGCGTGRVLIPLAQAGFQTIGLDKDLSMLRYTRKIIREGIDISPFLFMADICNFHLSVKFPLIILPCNTFSMLTEIERRACLGCVCRHLGKGGIFAVSLPNPKLLSHFPGRSDAELEEEFIHPISGNPVQVSSSWYRTEKSFDVTWFYDHLLPDGTVERLEVNASHHLTTYDSYMAEMREAGLIVKEIYGDFTRSAYTEKSPYLVILSCRQIY